MIGSGSRKRVLILLVDDDPAIVKTVARRLKSWGYHVLTAQSGEEGLPLAEEHRPDLILLDTMMPKMKGREVCARLTANPATKDIPVIFLTALSLPDHIKGGLDVGAADYVVKPFHADDLKDRIEVCLKRRQPSITSSSSDACSSTS